MPPKQKKNPNLEEKESMKVQGEEPVKKVVRRIASDSEYAAHSYSLRQILAHSDIDLPYCLNLDIIVQYIEEEIQCLQDTLVEANSDALKVSAEENSLDFLTQFQKTFPSAYVELVRKNLSSITKGLDDYIIVTAKDRKVGNEIAESDSKSDQKKKKKNKKKEKEKEMKSDEVAEPVTPPLYPRKSTHPSYYMRMAEDCGLEVPTMMREMKDESFRNCSQSAEELLATGQFDTAVEHIAVAVITSDQSEETLNKYKERFSPDVFAYIFERISWNEKIMFEHLSSTAIPRKDINQRMTRKMVNKHGASDSKYAAHSFHLLQFFAKCGLNIPRSLDFSGVCLYMENTIDFEERIFADCPAVVLTGSITGNILLALFQKTLPTKYFKLVSKKIQLITKMLDDYTISMARDRLERKKSLDDSVSTDVSTVRIRQQSINEVVACNSESIEKTKKNKKKRKRKKIERPESISGDIWQQFYDLGRQVSDFVLDAFALFESGDFSNWDKNRVKNLLSSIDKKNELEKRYRRNLVCEYILIERMKDKEFFCCLLCEETLFNWKQALIHFASDVHKKNENCAIIEGFRRVLNSFTDLPAKLGISDFQSYVERYTNMKMVRKQHAFPLPDFISYMYDKYSSLSSITEKSLSEDQRSAMEANKFVFGVETLIGRAKSDIGLAAMAELEEHLGLGKTCCVLCDCDTGSREEFYAHLLSAIHVHNSNIDIKKMETYCPVCCCDTGSRDEFGAHLLTLVHVKKVNEKTMDMVDEPYMRFCLLTLLVNVHKKDLI